METSKIDPRFYDKTSEEIDYKRDLYTEGKIDASQVRHGIIHDPATKNFENTQEWKDACKEFDKAFKTPRDAGVKNDSNKPRMELLDADFLEDTAKVLTEGAKKYSAHNWRNGISVGRLLGACCRHLFAILRGEDTDPEFGLPHTAHLACELMFLHWMLKNRKDLDDRWRKE